MALSAIPGFFGLNGGGQIYNGEINKGIVYFALGIYGGIWFRNNANKNDPYQATLVPALFVITNWIHGMVDAYKSANRINDRRVSIISPENSSLLVRPALIGSKSLGLETVVNF